MKRKLLALATPVGLLIYLVYTIGNRFFIEFPDAVAYPMMIASIILLFIGIAYHGYCFGKKKNPYNFKK